MNEYSVSARLGLFPGTALIEEKEGVERLHIGGCDLADLARSYGTPLYLYDQATLDDAVEAYRRALAESYAGGSGITYASKAFLCIAIAQWVQQQGLWLDCTGVGELRVAAAAGVSRDQILVHGVNKSELDLRTAVTQAGTLVVDSLAELRRLISLLEDKTLDSLPDLWLRIRPGLAVRTHTHTQTGQEDSKFGMSRDEVMEAAQICHQHHMPVTGLHFHQGSHFCEPEPVGAALGTALDLVQELQSRYGWLPEVLCPGGGWGVAYHEDDLPQPDIAQYVGFVARMLSEGCLRRGLPSPRLQMEPGRSIVARAGVALYRVGTVKHTAQRRWLLLDGGLADNPRPALYGARYSALPVEQPHRPASGPAWLAGPYCESGDILIEALPLPDIQPGELVAVPVSGAYHLSMASNYNGAPRPAVVWLRDGEPQLVQERERIDDLIRRDKRLQFPDALSVEGDLGTYNP